MNSIFKLIEKYKPERMINYIYAFMELLAAAILSRKYIWKLANYSAISGFRDTKITLSQEQEVILETIKSDGFAVTNLDFFNSQALENITLFQEKLQPKKSNIKDYLTYYLGGDYGNERQYFNSLNPLLEFSLNEELVSIINSYFNMLSSLCYLEINETKILNTSNPIKSQRFHRDPGIENCIKVFIYLNDIEINSGPFTYVKYSHLKDKHSIKSKRFGAGGIYPEEDSFKTLINKDNITPICGIAGTVIMADTTGLHCGGSSIDQTRKMATIVYYPPGDLKKSKIDCSIPHLDSSFSTASYLLSNK